MSNLCNFNWENAGSTTAGADTTSTTPAGPVLKCYKCDSVGGDCSEEAHGEEVECPQNKGCTISKTTGSDGSVMRRDCSDEKDVICDTIDNGEGQGVSILYYPANLYHLHYYPRLHSSVTVTLACVMLTGVVQGLHNHHQILHMTTHKTTLHKNRLHKEGLHMLLVQLTHSATPVFYPW